MSHDNYLASFPGPARSSLAVRNSLRGPGLVHHVMSDIPEDTEYFCAVLSTDDTAVNLSVNMINITILDDDNATNNIQRIGMVSFLYVINFQS